MPTIKITKVEVVPEGLYRLRILEADLRDSNKPTAFSDQFIGWKLLVVNSNVPGTVGKEIFHPTPVSFGSKSAGYKFLRAAGMPETDRVSSINTDHYVNQEFVAKITDEEKDGNHRNKLTEFWSLAEYQQMTSQNLAANDGAPPPPPVTPPPMVPPAVAPPPMAPPAVAPPPMAPPAVAPPPMAPPPMAPPPMAPPAVAPPPMAPPPMAPPPGTLPEGDADLKFPR